MTMFAFYFKTHVHIDHSTWNQSLFALREIKKCQILQIVLRETNIAAFLGPSELWGKEKEGPPSFKKKSKRMSFLWEFLLLVLPRLYFYWIFVFLHISQLFQQTPYAWNSWISYYLWFKKRSNSIAWTVPYDVKKIIDWVLPISLYVTMAS